MSLKSELRGEGECNLQARKSTTHAVRNTCVITSPEKKRLRFFPASLKVNDWYVALLNIRLLKICSDVVEPDVHDDS